MAERCPNCAPQEYGGHKLRVWKNRLWHVRCDCGWRPYGGDLTWGGALFIGQLHQRVAMAP